jgi:hypothetical protein
MNPVPGTASAPLGRPASAHGAGIAAHAAPRASSWRWGTAATLLFLAVAAYVGHRTLMRLNIAGDPHGQGWGLQDFRDAIYYPVVALLDGTNPYDIHRYVDTYPVGNTFPVYLPLTLVLHLPLGFLSFGTAELVYFLTVVVLMPVLAWLTLRLTGVRVSVATVFGLASLIVLSRPGYWNLFLGQYAATLAVGTYAALYFSRRRPWLAAVGVAVVSLKPTFGLPLAALMLARRDLRPLLAGLLIAGAVSAAALPKLVHNAGGVAPLVGSLRENVGNFDVDPEAHPVTSTYRIDTVAFLARFLGEPLGTMGDLAVLLGILGASGLAIWRLERRRDDRVGRLVSAGLACIALLACTYHQTYDLLMLTLPLTAVALARWRPEASVSPWLRYALVAALAIPAANYLVSDGGLRLFGTTGAGWLAVSSLNCGALLTAWVLWMLLAWRMRGDAAAGWVVRA